MARWNSQQCLTNPGVILSTGDAGGTAWDYDGVRSDVVTSGWIDTSMTEVMFFEWLVTNDQMGTPTTLVQGTSDSGVSQFDKIAYAEITMTSIYANKPITILRQPIQFDFPDLLNDNGALSDNAGTSAYQTINVVGVPRGVGTISVYASFAPNTPGAKVVAGFSRPSIGLGTVTNANTTYATDGFQPPTNTLGDVTYSSLELFYCYDATIDQNGIVQEKSTLSKTLPMASKFQAKLKVDNCFAYSKMTDSYQ